MGRFGNLFKHGTVPVVRADEAPQRNSKTAIQQPFVNDARTLFQQPLADSKPVTQNPFATDSRSLFQQPLVDSKPVIQHPFVTDSRSLTQHPFALDSKTTVQQPLVNEHEKVLAEDDGVGKSGWLTTHLGPLPSLDKESSWESKCAWFRSQIIGNNVKFISPFGKRRVVYADHTASGRSLSFIEAFIVQTMLPVYGNTHTDDSFVGQKTTRFMNKAADFVKNSMGGTEDEVLLFCGSGSTAAIKRLQEVMGIAVPPTLREMALKSIPDSERWVVFVGPYEHHSNYLSWRNSLAEVVEIPLNKKGLIDMRKLEEALQDTRYAYRPKLGSFSAGSNVTGTLSDTRRIARILHKYQAYACFDFAACAPYVEIDMRSGHEDGYDAVFVSPHKFMGGPGTPGLLLMNKNMYRLANLPPSTCGGGTVDYTNKFQEKDTIYLTDIEHREDAGTPAIIQKVRTALAFWIKERIGVDLISSRESLYIEKAIARLKKRSNIYMYGNLEAKRIAILSFNIYSTTSSFSSDDDEEDDDSTISTSRKVLHPRFVVKLLNDLFGIQARGGCSCAGPYAHALLGIEESTSLALRNQISQGYGSLKPGWARLSFGWYITPAEFDYILSAIEFIADFGERFLQFYDVDWLSGEWSFRKSSYPALPSGLEPGQLSAGREMVPQESSEFLRYLDVARKMTDNLPMHRPERRIPNFIDRSFIFFSI